MVRVTGCAQKSGTPDQSAWLIAEEKKKKQLSSNINTITSQFSNKNKTKKDTMEAWGMAVRTNTSPMHF